MPGAKLLERGGRGREGREVKRAGLELSSPKSRSLEPGTGSQRTLQLERTVWAKAQMCQGGSGRKATREAGKGLITEGLLGLEL